jgi:membrane-bound ClpP family serine protease
MQDPLSWLFGICLVLGVGYLLFTIVLGDLAEGAGDGEFNLLLGAIFLAGFGAFGLLAVLSQWSLAATLLSAVSFGYVVGRGGLWLLRAVLRQQTQDSIEVIDALVGMSARVTIDTPEGKIGEAMIENGRHITRSAIKEVDGHALKRGDIVQVINAESGLLYVKKKNDE